MGELGQGGDVLVLWAHLNRIRWLPEVVRLLTALTGEGGRGDCREFNLMKTRADPNLRWMDCRCRRLPGGDWHLMEEGLRRRPLASDRESRSVRSHPRIAQLGGGGGAWGRRAGVAAEGCGAGVLGKFVACACDVGWGSGVRRRRDAAGSRGASGTRGGGDGGRVWPGVIPHPPIETPPHFSGRGFDRWLPQIYLPPPTHTLPPGRR